MSYQFDRDHFIAAMASEGLPLWVTRLLLREATGINRRAELACSSEAADRDRVPCPASAWYERQIKSGHTHRTPNAKYPCLCDGDHVSGPKAITRIALQDWRAEERIRKALTEINVKQGHYTGNETQRGLWEMITEGDPRGYTLKVIPPSYHARNEGRDRFNREAIGVPARESRIQW